MSGGAWHRCVSFDGVGLGDLRADVLNEQHPTASDHHGLFRSQPPQPSGKRSLRSTHAGGETGKPKI